LNFPDAGPGHCGSCQRPPPGAHRIRFGRWLCAALLALTLASLAGWAQAQEQGRALPGLESFDRAMQQLLAHWNIPGASLAVAKDGRLLLAKGYGLADAERKTPMGPQTAFRMGSINKTLTAVLALQLEGEGRLSLDDPVLPWLRRLGLVPAEPGDARMKDITVRHLLQHSAGMDRERTGDALFQPLMRDIARRQNSAPVTCEAIVRDTLQHRLDFAPGERFAYSNTGYCMLGKVLEAAGGEPLQDLLSRRLLLPTIGKPYRLGSSLASAPDETRYHPFPGENWQRGAPGLAERAVPAPYGSYSIEAMVALGGWVATPTEVLKVFLAIDGRRGPALLSEAQLRRMREPPRLVAPPATSMRAHYGLGVMVVGTPQGDNWFHAGSQPGVHTLVLRSGRGWSWVVAFNSRPEPARRPAFELAFDQALWRAARAVQDWPEGDLF
jgi:CubicO group peptidase (beta-lactamase class C family)